jgi:histidinol-phosphate/aromatic aminotransferase/cobyric acid decarboxylase-like protein
MSGLRLHGDTLAGAGMIDFAVNVWPAARSPALERALGAALANNRYPDQSAARRALAERHGRSPDEVLVLNGACEAFWLIAQALRPRRAAVVHPAFTEPEAALLAAGAEVVRVMREPQRWSFDPADIPGGVDLVVVGNPNNPTGDVCPPFDRDGALVVVDGSFADFVPFDPEGDVVVRSLTKLWGLAGIRAGYLLGPRDVVAELERHRQPWSVNSLACAALEACARDRETALRVAAEVAAARERLVDSLRELAVRVWPSVANFVLAELPAAVEPLRAQGIAVRPCSSFPGLDDRYVRVAVRTDADNDLLGRAVEAIL